ncbi:P-loop NTPase fold protein [Kribbella karoonensis]|uniref:P-loop NTPase fold protein n=1 Tax=Kribbella karoonensis TaxID=324851 RepID=UPI0031DC0E7F
MYDRVVVLCSAVPRALDLLLARLMLRLTLDQLRERPEFVDADTTIRMERRETLRRLNRDLASATWAQRRRVYGRAVVVAFVSVVGLWIMTKQLGALGRWWAQSGRADVGHQLGTVLSALIEAGPVIIVVGAANVTVAAVLRRALRWSTSSLDEWYEAMSERLVMELRMLFNAEATRWTPTRLLVDRTPGLSGRDLDVPWIERACARRVHRLITELGATSVAVSGRRGVGKTTLLRRMLDSVRTDAPFPIRQTPQMRPPLAIFLQAPVDYAPKDFLIDLFAELCDKVIETDAGRAFGPRSLLSRAAARAIRFVGRFASVVLMLAILGATSTATPSDAVSSWLADRSADLVRSLGLAVPLQPEIALLALLGLGGVIVVLGEITKPGAGPLAREAATELAHLRYLQTLQFERALNLSRGLFGLGLRRARQLAQQPLTLPELVRRYRDFAEHVASEPLPGKGRGLLVAIDEMDRIASAESAEQFLNQIKAMFDVPGCIYLMSVSEDALAQFEQRVTNLRTTVDTSFDEVVWLPDLSLAESMDLLRRRVTGFPDLFLALCFCLSGGVPRDLLRAARTLVDVRHDVGVEQLGDITRLVVRREVQSFARGALRSASAPDEEDRSDVESFFQSAANRRWSGSLFDVVETLSHETADTASRAVLNYYAVIELLFIEHREIVEAALADTADADALRILEDLATARAMLPVSPRLATNELDDILGRLGARDGTSLA